MCSLIFLSHSLSYTMDSKKVSWGDRKASELRKQAWASSSQGKKKKTTQASSYKDALTNSSSPQKMMYRSSRQVIAQYHEEENTKKKQSAPQPAITLVKKDEVPVQPAINLFVDEQNDAELFIPEQPNFEEEETQEVAKEDTREFDQKTLDRLILMADMLPKVLANHEKVTTDLKNQLLVQAQAHADQMQTLALHFQQQLSATHREFDAQMLAQQKAHFAQTEKMTQEYSDELKKIHQILGLQNFHLYTAFVRLGLVQAVTVEQVEAIEQPEQQPEQQAE